MYSPQRGTSMGATGGLRDAAFGDIEATGTTLADCLGTPQTNFF